MLLWFQFVIPSFPARIDDMRSRFSALSHFCQIKMMEIENLWFSVKTFYFRNENVILRVPFCFFLQLGTYYDKIIKESKEEDAKTWYEIAGTRPCISWLLKTSSHVEKKS